MRKATPNVLFMRILLIILIILVGAPRLLLANEQFEFVSCVFEGLETCKIASERLKSGKEQDIVSVMKDLMVFTNEVRRAKHATAPHGNSKNEFVKEPAKQLHFIYSMVVENNENLLSFIEKTINDPSEASSKQGTWLLKMSEIAATNEELWRMIPYVTVTVSYALVDMKRKETGNLRFLTMTKIERDKLRSNLLRAFGESLKKGPKGGMLPIDASVSLMWDFLSKDWKPADSN